MNQDIKKYAESLYLALNEVDAKYHDQVISNFLEILKNNHHLGLYAEIVEEFERLDDHQKGVVGVNLTTAKDDSQDKEILDNLNSALGSNTKLTPNTNSDIIGGIVIKLEDQLLDASISQQLNTLKKGLME